MSASHKTGHTQLSASTVLSEVPVFSKTEPCSTMGHLFLPLAVFPFLQPAFCLGSGGKVFLEVFFGEFPAANRPPLDPGSHCH